jgi:hypothetical protein
MRKLATWLLVTLGIAALVRKLRRREELPEPAPPAESSAEEAAPPADATEDPAAELREKLAQSRAVISEPPASAAEESVEERRAAVYEQGRATLGDMQPGGEPAGERADEER